MDGNVAVTEEGVIAYLVEEFELKHEAAKRIVAENNELLGKGIQLGSYIYYTAGEIFQAAYPDGMVPEDDRSEDYSEDEWYDDGEEEDWDDDDDDDYDWEYDDDDWEDDDEE